jgi:hypothetical protein
MGVPVYARPVEVEIRLIRVGQFDVSEFQPADPKNFGESGTAYLGFKGGAGVDAFYFFVCTPGWLADRFDDPHSAESAGFWEEDEFSHERTPLMYYLPSPEPMTLFGTGLFLVEAWSADQLTRSIQAVCRRESGSDWQTVASRLGRLMPWEFDYRRDAEHP